MRDWALRALTVGCLLSTLAACRPVVEQPSRDLPYGFLLIQKKEYQALYGPNGRVQRLLRDQNGDGVAEVVVVFDADGLPEHGEIDSDGDGVVDRTESVSGLNPETIGR